MKMRNETVKIYGLIDPRTNLIAYIGQTTLSLELRLRTHINCLNSKKDKSKRKNWITSIINSGLKLTIELIDEVPFCDWEYWERHYIKLFKACGAKLYNGTNGGNSILTKKLEKKNRVKNIKPNGNLLRRTKQICQYDADGKFVKEWNTLKDIDLKKDCHQNICRSYIAKHKKAYGFYWRLGTKTEHGDVINTNFDTKHYLARPVLKFSKEGVLLKEYISISEASRQNCVTETCISNVCNKLRKTSAGFVWEFKK